MKPLACPGCKTLVGPKDDGMVVTTKNDAGVSTTTAICLPCLVRIHRDPEYARRFDQAAAEAVTGSIHA